MTRQFCSFAIPTKFIAAFLVSLIVASCASPPPSKVELNSQQHQQQLSELQDWQITGKIGFKSPEQKPKSASLSWVQKQQAYRLSLNTTFGISILSLQGTPQWATLNADDQTYSGTNASELIWQISGWTLPVEQLSTWIKGQSLKTDKVRLSEQGWIVELQPRCASCRGWQLNYSDYQFVNHLWLPHKIRLSHQLKHVQVTIKVNSWTTN